MKKINKFIMTGIIFLSLIVTKRVVSSLFYVLISRLLFPLVDLPSSIVLLVSEVGVIVFLIFVMAFSSKFCVLFLEKKKIKIKSFLPHSFLTTMFYYFIVPTTTDILMLVPIPVLSKILGYVIECFCSLAFILLMVFVFDSTILETQEKSVNFLPALKKVIKTGWSYINPEHYRLAFISFALVLILVLLGLIAVPLGTFFGNNMVTSESETFGKCVYCNGDGIYAGDKCNTCNGKGYVIYVDREFKFSFD